MAKEKDKIKKKRTLLQKTVNVFLYAGIVLFILFVLAFGFSQTSTFRNYLRDRVVKAANSELNGTVSIGKIDGTIFTSLILRNTIVNRGSDTLLNAGSIELRTSPFKILLKTIYVRYLEIKDAKIHLVKEDDGELNISKLLPASKPSPSKDTTASGFPFKIHAAVFKLSNVDFSYQNFDKINSREIYDNFNPEDIRITKLSLNSDIYAYIKNNDYEATIDDLSFDIDIKGIKLKQLEGNFQIQGDKVRINHLRVQTQNTDFMINAGADDFNLFGDTLSIEKALLKVNLDAPQFHFGDLSAFVPSTKILNGNIAVNLNASGTLKKLYVKNLEAALPNTHIQAELSVSNITDPDDMNFDAQFRDSYIDQDDISDLLPTLNIPVYKYYGLIKIDTLKYSGNPLNFNVNLYAQTDKGSVGAKGTINLLNKDIKYNLSALTDKLDISPIAGTSSIINSKITLIGKGTSPEALQTKINLIADGSNIEGNKIDSLRLTADANNKKIKYYLNVRSNQSSAKLNGNFDFSKQSDPSYDLEGDLKDINLAEFTKDTTLQTDLNFNVSAMGDKFSLNLINLFLSMKMYHSVINGINIDSTRAIVDLRHDDNGKRVVNIVSDLADITMIGKFTIPQTVVFLKGELGFLSTAFKDKADQFFPNNSKAEKVINSNLNKLNFDNSLIQQEDSLMDVQYAIEFKDFSLLSLFLGNNHLEIDGDISGNLKNSSDSISISLNTNLKYLKYWGKEDVFFLSNFVLNFNVENGINSGSLNDVNSEMTLSTDRVFIGSDIYDLLFNVKLNKDTADVSFSAKLEDYASAKLNAAIDLSDSTAHLNIDSLQMNYKTFALSNSGPMSIDYANNNIMLKRFIINRNGTLLELSGYLSRFGNENFRVSLSDLSLNDFLVNAFGFNSQDVPDSKIGLTINVSGTFANPKIDCSVKAENIKYKDKKFGEMVTRLGYLNRNLSVDLNFLDSLINKKKPMLSVSGNIPVDLSFQSVKSRLMESKPLKLLLTADNFSLGAFGDVLPVVNKLRGILAAKINITGTPNDLNPNGFLRLTNTSFLMEENNLEYDAGLKVSLNKESVSIDSLFVENTSETKDGGTMKGSGVINLQNLEATSFNLSMNGKLKILGNQSKIVSHDLFGDLVLATKGDIKIQGDKNGIMLDAPVIVDKAKITFIPLSTGYNSGSSKFVYKYVVDTTNQNKNIDFETLVNLARERSAKKSPQTEESSKVNFNVDVEVENEATIIVVLSKELNQNLTALVKGNLTYNNINGRPNAQGELSLEDGSTLDFIKTFKADGTIKFEGDLYDPNLDVTATYSDYYTPASVDSASSTQEVPVAVKIKIKGSVEQLNKNFIKEQNNIAVYYGQKNIDNDVPDPSKNINDAIMFIVTGRFTEGATQQDRNAVASTAASLAGSLLGSFLNQQLGDFVRSFEVRQTGATTKFNLSGKVKDFRYSIGGSTDVFQDISRANVKIEYPLYKSLLIRLERKEAVSETGLSSEMINELGLKYRFEF